MVLPDDKAIVIIAIEVCDVLTFGEACMPEVAAAIPAAVQAVLEELVFHAGKSHTKSRKLMFLCAVRGSNATRFFEVRRHFGLGPGSEPIAS